MAGFFNTITSPEEQAAADTGNDQPTSQQRSLRVLKPEDMPMGRIMAAVMRAGANVQGQEQAKKVANAQAGERSKLKVSMTANPAGGPPLLDIKNATPDLLNGTQAQDVERAYNTPKEQVEAKLNPKPTAAPVPPTTQPPADHPLEQAAAALEANGVQVVRPWGDEIKGATASEEALIDMDERLGIPEHFARDAWKRIKSGKLKPADVQRNLARIAATRLETDSHNLQATLSPYREEAHVKRQEDQQYLQTRNQLLDQKNTMQYDSEDEYLLAVRSGMNAAGGLRPGDEKLFSSAYRSNRIADLNAKSKSLSGTEGEAVIQSYQPNEVDRFISEQFNTRADSLSTFERRGIERLFGGLQDRKVRSAIDDARKVGALGAATTVDEAAAGIGLDPAAMTAKQKTQLSAAWTTANREWKFKGEMEKAQIQRLAETNQLERMKIQQQSDALAANQELVKMNTPEAVQQSVNSVLADGNQLYNLPTRTPIEKAYRAKVEAAVRATTGGRLPTQIKPGSEDDKRITVVAQGISDINKIEELYDKWRPIAPLGGPALAALNTAIIQNKPSSYLASVAMNVVPGYANLSRKQRQEYLADAATMAHRVNALTGRETRAVAGGRFSTQLFDVYKGTTPGFQSPETFHGLIEGARQEFGNAEAAVRTKQWGGAPPSTTPTITTATPTGPIVTDPKAILDIFKKKP